MRLRHGARFGGAEVDEEIEVLALLRLRALRRLHLLGRDVAEPRPLFVAPRLEKPVGGLEPLAILRAARHALGRRVLVDVLRARRLAGLLLALAGAVDAELARIHVRQRLVAL